METKFQTSFIPRKPLPATAGIASAVPHRAKSGGGGSIFMTIAVLAFFLSVLSIAGAYFWKQYLLSRQASYKEQLATREKQFNLGVISHLKVQSTKIGLARQLLASHIPVSQIFSVISSLTSEGVRFTAMELDAPNGISSPYDLALTGYSRDFSTVAFQADVLNKLEQYGLNTIVKNPIVSNPTLNQNGTVSFALTATVDLKALSRAGSPAANADASATQTP